MMPRYIINISGGNSTLFMDAIAVQKYTNKKALIIQTTRIYLCYLLIVGPFRDYKVPKILVFWHVITLR